jgi:hypothetical protein
MAAGAVLLRSVWPCDVRPCPPDPNVHPLFVFTSPWLISRPRKTGTSPLGYICVVRIVVLVQSVGGCNRRNILYGCETWSLTFREERRLWVFENRVLRGVFGPKRD